MKKLRTTLQNLLIVLHYQETNQIDPLPNQRNLIYPKLPPNAMNITINNMLGWVCTNDITHDRRLPIVHLINNVV